eukprot:COSAG05_NODE_927_length_6569_cov_13.038485_4_plen_177_part_00
MGGRWTIDDPDGSIQHMYAWLTLHDTFDPLSVMKRYVSFGGCLGDPPALRSTRTAPRNWMSLLGVGHRLITCWCRCSPPLTAARKPSSIQHTQNNTTQRLSEPRSGRWDRRWPGVPAHGTRREVANTGEMPSSHGGEHYCPGGSVRSAPAALPARQPLRTAMTAAAGLCRRCRLAG